MERLKLAFENKQINIQVLCNALGNSHLLEDAVKL